MPPNRPLLGQYCVPVITISCIMWPFNLDENGTESEKAALFESQKIEQCK